MNLDELEGLAREATPPNLWKQARSSVEIKPEPYFSIECFAGSEKNAALIVAAVNALPRLVAIARAAEKAQEALSMAMTGLEWYRGVMPEFVDGSDAEADEEINAAIAALREAMEGGK